MELWQLRTFSVVAKNLHFTRAAEELNLSQPAVSHQIKLLEEEIGEQLFLRQKDGIFLTNVGKTMFQHANKILDIAEEMRLEIKENQNVVSGKIILGVVTQGLGNPFPFLYEKFKKKFPEIDIVFQREPTLSELVEKVQRGSIDIALAPSILELNSLVTMPYGVYDLVFVVGKGHRLSEKEEVTVEDLKNEEWVAFERGSRVRQMFDEYLGEASIFPKGVYETNDGVLIRSMVANHNRISLLPEWGVFEELQDGRIIKIRVKGLEYRVQVNIIWKESRRTKVMTAVLNYVLQEKLEGVKVLKARDYKS